MIELINVLEDFGLIIKSSLKLNKWVATPTRDKPNKKNGRYFYNGEVCFFKNWATGEQSYWLDKQNQLKSYSTEQRNAYIAALNAKRREVEAEDRKLKFEEVNKAFGVLKVQAVTHPYLERKQALIRADFKIDFRHSCLQRMLAYFINPCSVGRSS